MPTTMGFNLQCNNVARHLEEKGCPYYRTFMSLYDFSINEYAVVKSVRGRGRHDSLVFWTETRPEENRNPVFRMLL